MPNRRQTDKTPSVVELVESFETVNQRIDDMLASLDTLVTGLTHKLEEMADAERD